MFDHLDLNLKGDQGLPLQQTLDLSASETASSIATCRGYELRTIGGTTVHSGVPVSFNHGYVRYLAVALESRV